MNREEPVEGRMAWHSDRMTNTGIGPAPAGRQSTTAVLTARLPLVSEALTAWLARRDGPGWAEHDEQANAELADLIREFTTAQDAGDRVRALTAAVAMTQTASIAVGDLPPAAGPLASALKPYSGMRVLPDGEVVWEFSNTVKAIEIAVATVAASVPAKQAAEDAVAALRKAVAAARMRWAARRDAGQTPAIEQADAVEVARRAIAVKLSIESDRLLLLDATTREDGAWRLTFDHGSPGTVLTVRVSSGDPAEAAVVFAVTRR